MTDGDNVNDKLGGSFTDDVNDFVEVDAIGMDCPMPLLKAKRALNSIASGECVLVLATDQGSVRDFQVFAQQSGHLLLRSDEEDGVYRYLLQKR